MYHCAQITDYSLHNSLTVSVKQIFNRMVGIKRDSCDR